MRLIDADKLDKEGYVLQRTYQKDEKTMVHEVKRLKDVPSIDAVQVVRCKDCRWGREPCGGNIECWVDRNIPPEYQGYEWFCPNGEKREE